MKFNVKVKMNSVNKIIKDHGLNENGRVIKHLRDTADRLMMPFIPRRSRRQFSQN
mgnify:CR=1 FL=1